VACDCLAHPYRGEGFGLPLLEAMACGRPAVVTGLGAALDFCDEATSFLVPARQVRALEKRVGVWETADFPWLAEPDLGALTALLRHVAGHPEEARAKGETGRARAHRDWTWDQAAAVVEARLRALWQRPPRRRPAPAGCLDGLPRLTSAGRPRVSLCLIVKDEEHNLPACLGSAADLVEEIVVVDTGSTDGTKAVAARFGARVFDFPWVDSFAAARNESLRHATGDWVFWLDADDRLDDANRRKLRALFAALPDVNVAFSMKCRCLPDPSGTATEVDHVRLFRNHPRIRWRFRVHEQILPAVRDAGGQVRWADVVIEHAGYQDPALRGRKLQRDLRLLQLEQAEQPDHPFTLFNLGSVTRELGRPAEALPLLRRSLERSHPQDSIVRKLYALIVGCHRDLGQAEQALAACRAGLNLCPDDAELLFLGSVLCRERGDLAGAEGCLLRLLNGRPGKHFASVTDGLRGYKARNNLALLHRQQGRDAEAEAQWRQALAERPDFANAWIGLAELLLGQRRWPDLEEAARRLETEAHGPVEAAVLRARGLLARGEFAAGRGLLEQTIAVQPRALWPRVVLSHALLQEGRDPNAAERALHAVLELDPGNAEARTNLAVLRRQRQQA
jgi:Tfp pilus assembly protein PilF